jgi:hypothetical protein
MSGFPICFREVAVGLFNLSTLAVAANAVAPVAASPESARDAAAVPYVPGNFVIASHEAL